MMDERKLDTTAGKAGAWYTIGNFLLKGCAFLSLPIFTRLLSTSDFGIYNIYMAYEGILSAILGLGMYGTVKNAKLDYKEQFESYLSSVLSLNLLILGAVLIIANVFYDFYCAFLGFSRFVTNCLILQSFGAYLIYFYGAKLNIEFKYRSYIAISCLNTLGNIFLSIILIRFVFPNERYLGRILGSAMPLIIVAVLLCGFTIYRGKTFFNRAYWKYAVSIGLPLVPHLISQSLLAHSDRIMISNMVGDSEAGIYSYINTLCTIMLVLFQSLDNAWTPWVYMKLQAKKHEQIKKASKVYIDFCALLSLGFICVMPEVMRLIAGSEYWQGESLLIPLALVQYCIFLYMMPVNIAHYNKETKYISIGTMGSLSVNLILNYIAINLFGYKGPAYTTLFSYFILFLFYWCVASKFEVKNVYSLKHILKTTLYLLVISAAILLTSGNRVINIALRYAVAVGILLVLFRKKNVIIGLFKGKRQ